MSRYSDVHRLFLQSIMSHRMLSENSAVAVLQKIHDALNQDVEGPLSETDLKKVIKLINGKINALNMEIRTEVCETSSEKFVLLVNTVSTPIHLTMTKYTEGERQFFKKIVDEIVGSDSGRISSIVCLNMCEQFNMSKADQEALIKQLVGDMWLVDEEGKLSLSVRSISELTPYLRNAYKDFLFNCALCKALVFQGFRCQRCTTICHRHCLSRYAKHSIKQGAVTCPGSDCDAVLENIGLFVNMDEVQDDEPVAERSQSQPPSKKPRQAAKNRR